VRSALDKKSLREKNPCLAPMSESLKTCHDHLQLRRLLQLHQCLRRRLNYEKKVLRAQGLMKEQAAKDSVTEVRERVAIEV
jgi:hypothetical protein